MLCFLYCEHGRASHGGAQRGGAGQANSGSGGQGGRRAGEQVEWAASASGPNALVGQRGKIRKMRWAGYQGYRAATGLGRDEK
jgi:hypothetical protein